MQHAVLGGVLCHAKHCSSRPRVPAAGWRRYHATFKENEELKQRMRKMRGDLGAQTHTRARSTYGKVASAAGLNVFEHCKRLERDLPSSSRCLANFQRVLKAIDKQVSESCEIRGR